MNTPIDPWFNPKKITFDHNNRYELYLTQNYESDKDAYPLFEELT